MGWDVCLGWRAPPHASDISPISLQVPIPIQHLTQGRVMCSSRSCFHKGTRECKTYNNAVHILVDNGTYINRFPNRCNKRRIVRVIFFFPQCKHQIILILPLYSNYSAIYLASEGRDVTTCNATVPKLGQHGKHNLLHRIYRHLARVDSMCVLV